MSSATVAAPPEYAERAAQAVGATALAAAAALPVEVEAKPLVARKPAQTSLFTREPESKVIPFDAAQRIPKERDRSHGELFGTSELPPPTPRSHGHSKKRLATDALGDQTSLDFLPTASPQQSRTLKTNNAAVIYCDAPVAGPVHRAMAGVLDGAMILLGLGIFLLIFQVFGGSLPFTKTNMALLGGAAGSIWMLYGFLFMLAGAETPGMKWADLRIINFNGFPPDRKTRAVRMIGCWLSLCSGLIGIVWALVDEEKLTWHDHMSKTFPTLRETNAKLVRS